MIFVHEHADPVSGQRRGGDEQAVQHDARHHALFKQGAALDGRVLHDIAAGGVYAQGDGGQRVGGEVDEEDVHRQDGHFPTKNDCQKQDEDLGDVARHEELDDLLDVAVHPSALADGVFDGGEVVV